MVAHLSVSNTNRESTVSLASGTKTVREAFIQFDRLWAGRSRTSRGALSMIAEGDGTMLDNTLIYWGVESGTDHNHSPRDLQYLLIGGKNMGFQSGQLLAACRHAERPQAPHERAPRLRLHRRDGLRHRSPPAARSLASSSRLQTLAGQIRLAWVQH